MILYNFKVYRTIHLSTYLIVAMHIKIYTSEASRLNDPLIQGAKKQELV